MVSSRVLICSAVWIASVAAGSAAEKPRSLVAMEESRRAIQSGAVQWSVLPEGDSKKAVSFVSRYAKNGDMIFEDRGDPDGWTVVNTDGAGIMKYPQLYLNNSDGSFYTQQASLSCKWWKKDGQPNPWVDSVKDIRTVGICVSAFSVNEDMGFRSVWDTPNYRVTEWSEKRVGDIYEVEGRCQSGGIFHWYINPAKGWNAERMEFENAGVHQEAVCSLKQFGNVWLPETTDYFEDGKLVESIQIRSAELNQPSDKSRFAPGDLGLESGTRFSVQNIRSEPGNAPFWNGDDIVAEKTWYDDVHSGRRQWGPTFRRMIAGEDVNNPYDTEETRKARAITRAQLKARYELTKDRGLWEKYVKDFIKKYELDDAQSAQAMRILDMCQKRAEEVLTKRRPEMLAVINELHGAKAEKDEKKTGELTARLNKLREPIEEIFEKELKPRLDKLPTRAQRQAADGRADSRAKAPTDAETAQGDAEKKP